MKLTSSDPTVGKLPAVLSDFLAMFRNIVVTVREKSVQIAICAAKMNLLVHVTNTSSRKRAASARASARVLPLRLAVIKEAEALAMAHPAPLKLISRTTSPARST